MGGATATFDYAAWVAQFPEFKNVSQATAQSWFNTAGILYLRNDGTGPCSTAAIQLELLNFMTAHLLAINGALAAPGSSPASIVGRISNASQGSVSVTTENLYPPGSAQWYQQTKYGAMFWQGTLSYRQFRYLRPSGHGVGGVLGASGFPGGQVGGVQYPLGFSRRRF